MSVGFWQQYNLACKGFFTTFPSKSAMPLYMKVVPLNKIYNFPKGRILSVQVKFGERGKSSGRHLWTLDGKGV
jgi:hypothetical protein